MVFLMAVIKGISHNLSTKRTFYSQMDVHGSRHECGYVDCSNVAATFVYTNGNVPDNVWPNESYQIGGTTYSKSSTYLTPKKDKYLVPDEKGFRVETERGWEEKSYTSGSYTRNTISGYYCAEHTEAGESLIRNGVEHAKMRTNILEIAVIVIVGMFPWLWMLRGNIKAKRKAAKAQKKAQIV